MSLGSFRREISAEHRCRSDHDRRTSSSVMLSAFSLDPGYVFFFFLFFIFSCIFSFFFFFVDAKPPEGGRSADDKSDGTASI